MILQQIRKNDYKLHVLGAGSNTLFRDKGVKGVVIKLSSKFSDIKQKKMGPKTLVANLQNLIQKILQHYSIESSFVEGAPGVYVGEKKIASIGLRISKGRTYHGISLNVDMDLTPFGLINPCGYEGLEVTQISNFDSNVTLEDVESVAIKEMQILFS